MRRQNYSFPATTPLTPHTSSEMHHMRVILAVLTAVAVNLATLASVSMLITGR